MTSFFRSVGRLDKLQRSRLHNFSVDSFHRFCLQCNKSLTLIPLILVLRMKVFGFIQILGIVGDLLNGLSRRLFVILFFDIYILDFPQITSGEPVLFEDELPFFTGRRVCLWFFVNYLPVLRTENRTLPFEKQSFLLLKTALQGKFVQVGLRLLSNSIYLLDGHSSAPALNKYLCTLQVNTYEHRNVIEQNHKVENDEDHD